MDDQRKRVCPVELADSLDSKLRRWLQNPRKIFKSYIQEGMTVLDVGCGPGFFSIELAKMVGPAGRVIAADLQEGMLQKIRDKISGTTLEDQITLHKCETDKIGWPDQVDFIVAYYMVHEVPDQQSFFSEIARILKSGGQIFIAEPPFHTTKAEFNETIRLANKAGLTEIKRPRIFPDKVVLLERV